MTLHGARMNALHGHGRGEGVGDGQIIAALVELKRDPALGGDSMLLDDLFESGYIALDAPHSKRRVGE